MSEETQDSEMETQDSETETEQTQLTQKEVEQIEKALDKMRKFLDGNTDKKRTTNKLQKQLDSTATDSMQIQSVGGVEGVDATSSILMDGITSALSNMFSKQDIINQLQHEKDNTNDYKAKQDLYTQIQQLDKEIENNPMRRYFI